MRRSLVNGAVASNLTSAKIEGAQNDLWSQSVDQSSVPTGESSQSSSRTKTGSKDVESNAQSNPHPYFQELTETRQPKQSQTSAVPSSQSVTTSQLQINTTSLNRLATKNAQLNQSQSNLSAIKQPTTSQSIKRMEQTSKSLDTTNPPKQSLTETAPSSQFSTKSGHSAAVIEQYSQSEVSPVTTHQRRAETASTSHTTDPVQPQTNSASASQSRDIVRQPSQSGNTTEDVNHSLSSTISDGLSSTTTSPPSNSEVSPLPLFEQSTKISSSQTTETAQSRETQTGPVSSFQSQTTVRMGLTSQSSDIKAGTTSTSSTTLSVEASSQSEVSRVPLSQQLTTTTFTRQSTGNKAATTKEPSSQPSTTKVFSEQKTTTAGSINQASDIAENHLPTNMTPPSWKLNKGGPSTLPAATKISANQSPLTTTQNRESESSREPAKQLSTHTVSVYKGTDIVTAPTGQTPSPSASLDRITQTSQSPTTSVMFKSPQSVTASSPGPTETTNLKQSQSQRIVPEPIQTVKKVKHSSQQIESTTSARKSLGISTKEKQIHAKAPSRQSSLKKTGSNHSPVITAKSGQSLNGTEPGSQLPVGETPVLYSGNSILQSTQLSSNQTPPSPSATSPTPTSQSVLTTTFSKQSPPTSVPTDQSVTSSRSSQHTSNDWILNNHTFMKLVNTDQSPNGSLSMKKLATGSTTSGNSVSGAFTPDDRPVNVSQLTRQAKEALKSLKHRTLGKIAKV